MLITEMEPISKTRTRVTINYDQTLVLSNKDILVYDLRQDGELEETVYREILEAQRSAALVRAGNLLKGVDYTRKGLTDKLVRAGYPEMIAGEVVTRLCDAHYLDDRRYAENYIRYHLQDRSLYRVRMDLLQKGIERDLLDEVLRGYEEEHHDAAAAQELQQIHRFLTRKHYMPGEMTYEETARIQASLLRKGYSMERIREAIRTIN